MYSLQFVMSLRQFNYSKEWSTSQVQKGMIIIMNWWHNLFAGQDKCWYLNSYLIIRNLLRVLLTSAVGVCSNNYTQGEITCLRKWWCQNTKEKREIHIVEALQKYSTQIHPKGETLPDCTRIYRVKVVEAFLKAGIPLQKLDSFRSLLEESAFNLSGSQHMRDLIPFILSEEHKQIQEELRGKNISVIFDGTTHVAEAMAIIVRYVSSDWIISQRLVRALLVTKSMSREEVACELIGSVVVTVGGNGTATQSVWRCWRVFTEQRHGPSNKEKLLNLLSHYCLIGRKVCNTVTKDGACYDHRCWQTSDLVLAT